LLNKNRIMSKNIIVLISLLIFSNGWSQSEEYQKEKAEKIKKGSVFTKIINRELRATIVYEDDELIAFVPLRKQAPVHYLIVPKKEIYTISDKQINYGIKRFF